MVAQPIRAVYEHRQLRLLDPVDWAEGQKVQITAISERERGRTALKDVAMKYNVAPKIDTEIDEVALLAQITADMQGKLSISDAIIEERRNAL